VESAVTIVHKLIPLVALGLNLLMMGGALYGDRKQQRNSWYAAVALALSVWSLGVFGLRSAESVETAMFWERVLHVGVIPIPVLFYHYVLAFLDVSRLNRTLWIGYLVVGLFIAVSPTPLFMRGVVESDWGYMPIAGPLYAPFVVYFQAYLVIGLVRLLREYRASAVSFRRNRMLLVILGVCINLVGGGVDFIRFVLGWQWLYPVGIPCNAIFSVTLGVAVIRYRLWDISVLARRILLYAVLTVMAILPLVLGWLSVTGRLTSYEELPPNLGLSLMMVAIVAAAIPCLRYAEAACERVMFARQHGVRDTLRGIARDAAAILDLERLGAGLTRDLVERVPVVQAALYMPAGGDDESFLCHSRATSNALDAAPSDHKLDPRLVLWLRLTAKPVALDELAFRAGQAFELREVAADLEAAGVALLVPILLDGHLAGVLVVGEKLSGEVFDAVEIDLLQTLAGQTAIALQNARLYGDVQRQMHELKMAQQQLLQAAKLAAIGELAASVAHELNNPLTVIVGRNDQLIRRLRQADPEAVPLGEMIKAEAQRATRIVRGLLDYSRRREPKREPLNVNLLVPRALDLLQAKLRGRKIDVQLDLAATLPPLIGDMDQITQVLINLIGNAIDAMPGGGRLTVGTAHTVDLERVAFSIQDSGTGMTPAQMEHIFEPFYSTKPEGEGTGLGLSVTLGIVNSHGGSISVDSRLGTGTTMTVQLPVATREVAVEVAQ
jgi:signal transduction histidine kinase